MYAPRISQRALLTRGCDKCQLTQWCPQNPDQICTMPPTAAEMVRFCEINAEEVRRLGGVGPRKLAPVPDFSIPRVLHVHVDLGGNWAHNWLAPLVVQAADVLSQGTAGLSVSRSYLSHRKLLHCPKVLAISGKDLFLQSVLQRSSNDLCAEIRAANFQAVIGPNLSAYYFSEHRVWLVNRALCQLYLDFLLRSRVNAILHLYLPDSSQDQDWLVEYLNLNPSQRFIATGFDFGMAKSRVFFNRRLELLRDVEERIHRPLYPVLCSVTCIERVATACKVFPGRVHVLTSDAFNAAMRRKRLRLTDQATFDRIPEDFLSRGDLAGLNMRAIEEAYEQIPCFSDMMLV